MTSRHRCLFAALAFGALAAVAHAAPVDEVERLLPLPPPLEREGHGGLGTMLQACGRVRAGRPGVQLDFWQQASVRQRIYQVSLGRGGLGANGFPAQATEGDRMHFRLMIGYHYLVDICGAPPAQVVAQWQACCPGLIDDLKNFEGSRKAADPRAPRRYFWPMAQCLGHLYLTPLAAPSAAPSARPTTAVAPHPAAPVAPEREGIAGPAALLAALLAASGGLAWAASRRASARPRALSDALRLLDSGDSGGALPVLQRTLASSPAHAHEIRCHLIRCLLADGQLDLALQAYAELDPGAAPPEALYDLARALEDRGQQKPAMELYARLYLQRADHRDVKARYEALKSTQTSTGSQLWVRDLTARLPARFTQVERLGEGGMGIVLKAHDSALGQFVAIKVVSPAAASDETFIRRFRREAKALVILNHPAIIRILDVQTSPIDYYTMEYCHAPSLRQVLEKGALPPARVARIGAQIARALEHAHGQGIVHRDIKPANVMLGEGDAVKVLDFGLAQVAGASALTMSHQAPGTLVYMAPEQVDGRDVGAPADVYALGLVLWELVRGTRPFPADAPLKRLTDGVPALPAGPAPQAELGVLIGRCTAREPGARPSAAEVAAALEGMARGA